MVMPKLVPETLYIIRDRDFRTLEWGPYVKIGIVRQDRDSEARKKEHQTGNPREVVTKRELQAPMVEHLETQLHQRFATNWVTGEWFEMDDLFVEQKLIPEADHFLSMLYLSKRKYQEEDAAIPFKTPESWLTTPAVRITYREVLFERSADKSIPSERILGVGHAVVDQALRQSLTSEAGITTLPQSLLPDPLIVFRITDKGTSRAKSVRAVLVGIEGGSEQTQILADWELLTRLNDLLAKRTLRRDQAMSRPADANQLEEVVSSVSDYLESKMTTLDLPFDVSEMYPVAVFWPAASSDRDEYSDAL